jgi:hypothetical protein
MEMYKKLLGFALLASLFICSFSLAGAGVKGTIACDWRNTPNWHAIADSNFEASVIFPRSQSARGGWAADSLKAHGVRVYFAHQPWLGLWKGQPIKDWKYDSTLWVICEKDSLWLRDSTGAIVHIYGDIDNALVPDFRIPEVVDAWGRAIAGYWPKADGWHFDYGDLVRGISWVPSCKKVRPADMAAWTVGYKQVVGLIRSVNSGSETACWCSPMNINFCSIWPFENVAPYYTNQYSYERVLTEFRTIKRLGGRGLLFCQRSDVPSYRRTTAAICLLTDSYFNWRHFYSKTDPNWAWNNLRDMEHFVLDIGTAPDSCIEVAPKVWQRKFTRGIVTVNVSPDYYRYVYSKNQQYPIAPGDALVVQDRSKNGRFIKLITNYYK